MSRKTNRGNIADYMTQEMKVAFAEAVKANQIAITVVLTDDIIKDLNRGKVGMVDAPQGPFLLLIPENLAIYLYPGDNLKGAK